MNRDGYFLLKGAHLLGARLHVHWSAVAVSVVLLAAWHRQPGLALEAVACYFGLLLLHEAGHAAMARRLGYRALDIQLSLLHGRCWYEQPDTFREEATIAWGGVLAQLVIAIPLVAWAQIPSFASSSFAGIFVAAFGYFSLAMAALNLAPVRGLDGAVAWRLLPILARACARASPRATRSRAVCPPHRSPARRVANPVRRRPSTERAPPRPDGWLPSARGWRPPLVLHGPRSPANSTPNTIARLASSSSACARLTWARRVRVWLRSRRGAWLCWRRTTRPAASMR